MNKRYLTTLKLYTIFSPMKRAQYLKKKNIFHHIGERVMITSRKIPLYPNLISIGSNVWIASKVEFITHDVVHYMLNGLNDGKFQEKIGCIEIGNNVFIGTGVKIMYDTKIGDNVIIAAGSIVTKDVPSGTVVAGVPARVIDTFEDLKEKRKKIFMISPANNMKQYASDKCEKEAWEIFNNNH